MIAARVEYVVIEVHLDAPPQQRYGVMHATSEEAGLVGTWRGAVLTPYAVDALGTAVRYLALHMPVEDTT